MPTKALDIHFEYFLLSFSRKTSSSPHRLRPAIWMICITKEAAPHYFYCHSPTRFYGKPTKFDLWNCSHRTSGSFPAFALFSVIKTIKKHIPWNNASFPPLYFQCTCDWMLGDCWWTDVPEQRCCPRLNLRYQWKYFNFIKIPLCSACYETG